ncbi:cyclic nucleotide-binding-like protein [Paraphysoderma sedebokerense]|nr:cyclic nucleotide-binding-like protein [Paraphysoderma sedebokerense]
MSLGLTTPRSLRNRRTGIDLSSHSLSAKQKNLEQSLSVHEVNVGDINGTTAKEKYTETPINRFRRIAWSIAKAFAISTKFLLGESMSDKLERYINTNQDSTDQYRSTLIFLDFKVENYIASHAASSVPPNLRRLLRDVPIQNRTSEDLERIRNYLKRFMFFEENSSGVQRGLCKVAEYLKFERGRLVLKEGHTASSFYFVLSGRADVFKTEFQPTSCKVYMRVLSQLRAGDTFGELAIIRSSNRTASVIVQESTELLKVDKVDFERIIKLAAENERENKSNFLKSMPLFDILEPHAFETLIDGALIQEFGKNQLVYQEGDTSEHMYFVLKGHVRVIKCLSFVRTRSSNGKFLTSSYDGQRLLGPNETVIRRLIVAETLSEGSYFGQDVIMSLASGEELLEVMQRIPKRETSIVTSDRCDLIQIRIADLLKLLNGGVLELIKMVDTDKKNWRDGQNEIIDKRNWESFKHKVVKSIVARRTMRKT